MFLPEPLVIHPRPDILVQGYGRLTEIFPHVPVLLVQRGIQGGGFPQDAVRNFHRYVHGLVEIGVRIVGDIRKQGVQVFHQGSLVVGTAGFLQDGIGQFPDTGGFYLVPLCQLEFPAQGLHLFPERLVFFRQEVYIHGGICPLGKTAAPAPRSVPAPGRHRPRPCTPPS